MREAIWNLMPAAVESEPKKCWISVDEGQYKLGYEMCRKQVLEEYHRACTP